MKKVIRILGIKLYTALVMCDGCGESETFTDLTFDTEIYERIYDNGWVTAESIAYGKGMNPNNSIFTTFYCSPECLPFPQSSIVKDKDEKIATFNSVGFRAGVGNGNLLFLKYLERVESELSTT